MVKVEKNIIDELLKNAEINVTKEFGKVTVVTVKLENGFVLTESSGCISEENYDEEIGKQSCLNRIKEKLWLLEGYKLQSEIYEIDKPKTVLNLKTVPNYSIVTEITGRRGFVFKDQDFSCIRYFDENSVTDGWNDVEGSPAFRSGRRIIRVDVPKEQTHYLNPESHRAFLNGKHDGFKTVFKDVEFQKVFDNVENGLKIERTLLY